MITDDPGTPGNGHWENNLAITFERRANEVALKTPAIDLNYGLGEHIQLTLQTAYVILKSSHHGPIGGLGSTEAAVKWRFLDEERSGFAMSAFPRIIFNSIQSSVRRGLADAGTRVQTPLQIALKIGPFAIDGEFGPLFNTAARSEWLYGIVGGLNLAKNTSVMAELHGTSWADFSRDVLTVNFGLRQKLTDSAILITSLGHDMLAPHDQALAFIGYFGVQLLF
jgi:hypothetical protein